MLSIGKLGKGQERYYLDKVAEGAEDYYSGEGEAAGQWIGDAATELGPRRRGRAEASSSAMLTGRNPVDGDPLGLRGVAGRGAVPGFDLTFSAPKSVSLLWGLGGAEVAGARSRPPTAKPSQAALGYMQREACWTRRGAGGAEFVQGYGYLAAAYLHRSSRNGDPQLHTHVLIANATQGPDGRWTRLYHPAIYDHATTACYLYEAHLRDELARRLGVEWQQPQGHRRDRGLRRRAPSRLLHPPRGNPRGGRRERLGGLAPGGDARHPQAEGGDVSEVELRQRWRARADEIGLDREAIERTFEPEPAPSRDGPTSPQLEHAVTGAASHFDRRDAIQAVADSLRNGAPCRRRRAPRRRVPCLDSVIQIAETAKGPRYTTRRIWELEREALAAVERMNAERASIAGELIATPGDRVPPDPEDRPARDYSPPARKSRARRRCDRRGGYRQDLRHRRRGRGLGAGGDRVADCGTDLAGGRGTALRRPAGRQRRHPALRIGQGQAKVAARRWPRDRRS